MNTYPVKNCHFCDHIMLYTRYENGESYVYCNNNTSCMGFTYSCNDNNIKVKTFTISDDSVLQLRVYVEDDITTNFILTHSETIRNLIKIEPSIILNKEKSIKLLAKIRKAVLLLD